MLYEYISSLLRVLLATNVMTIPPQTLYLLIILRLRAFTKV